MAKNIYKDFQQGVYKPRYPEKYKGTGQIFGRSSYEFQAFKLLDCNPNVLEWTSESLAIPYVNPTKQNKDGSFRVSRYFPDLTAKMKTKTGEIKDFLIEIKPKIQTMPPNPRSKKAKCKILMEQVKYAQNVAKWNAAKNWCEQNNHVFIILTEKELFNK